MTRQPIALLLRRLWRHLSRRRRLQFALLLLLMLAVSFAEVVKIGAVLPFLGVLINPQQAIGNPAAQALMAALQLDAPEQMLLPLTILFALAALLAGAMRMLLLWFNTRLSFAICADLSIDVYRRTLHQPYAVHCARNSSAVISGITQKVGAIANNTITPLLALVSASVMALAILGTLLLLEPVVSLLTFGGAAVCYLLLVILGRKRLQRNSQCVARESVLVHKSLQEGLGGIRDVLLDGSQDAFCHIYGKSEHAMRHAQGNNTIIFSAPQYVMETLGMLIIIVLAYLLSLQAEGVARAIPLLGALALGAQRLLPALHLAYASWSNIRGYQTSLQDSLDLLDQPMPERADQRGAPPMPFAREIRLRQVDFRYSPQSPWVLRGLDLSIPKGGRIGFIGVTGGGKSTLLDIVMALLQPVGGALEVDGEVVTQANGRAWQAHIAHVPQYIFLSDSSVEENIAFGAPRRQIDRDRVRRAAQQAMISDSIEAWPQQYQTLVGERGVRLSGGQRQRIGIARALYKQADVIIFDEATSALDNATENAVMNTIAGLDDDLTLLIIAHRLTTLKGCSQIVEIGDGGVRRCGSWDEIIGANAAPATGEAPPTAAAQS